MADVARRPQSAKERNYKKRLRRKQPRDQKPDRTAARPARTQSPSGDGGIVEYTPVKIIIPDAQIQQVAAYADLQAAMDAYARPLDPETPETMAEDITADALATDSDADSINEAMPDAKEPDDTDGMENGRLSRKQRKALERLTVAELKQQVACPEAVDWVDATARDPHLLVHLKATRNTVPVPVHWQQKRKYLQGKRGVEKPPFVLPDYVRATGISEIRTGIQQRDAQKSLRQKGRDRMRARMGAMDIDYQRLHDAFFVYQTKPRLTGLGDVYFEGKELQKVFSDKRPGELSAALRHALGLEDPTAPPPWLVQMQRFGPPPSYPGLVIPGVNAPLPLGAEWGFHPGGWGKPPLDIYGRPLYGNVFGASLPEGNFVEQPVAVESVDREFLFGELEADAEAPVGTAADEDDQQSDDAAMESVQGDGSVSDNEAPPERPPSPPRRPSGAPLDVAKNRPDERATVAPVLRASEEMDGSTSYAPSSRPDDRRRPTRAREFQF